MPRSYKEVLTNRNFLILWGNQILLQSAFGILNFSMVFLIRTLTGSNLGVSFYLLTIILPAILFGIFAGVLVDMLDRRRIIIFTDFLLALTTVAFLIFSKRPFLILPFAFIYNMINQFFIPAESSSIPMIVQKRNLLLANSFFIFTMYGTQILGVSAAGPLIYALGYELTFFIIFLILTLAFFLVQFLPSLDPLKGKKREKILVSFNIAWQETLERVIFGLRFIQSKAAIWQAIVVLIGMEAVIGTLVVLAPGFFEDVLKVDPTQTAYSLILPTGLGLVSGAFLVGRFGNLFPRRVLVTLGTFGAGTCLSLIDILGFLASLSSKGANVPELVHFFVNLLPFTTSIGFLCIVLGMSGVSILIPARTVLQEQVPIDVQGRVFSVVGILIASIYILPIILTGAVADIFGIVVVLVGLGVLIIIAGLILLNPQVIVAFIEGKRVKAEWE
jgi:MFS family permease